MNALDYISNEHKYSLQELYQIFGDEAQALLNKLENKKLMQTNDDYDEKEMMTIIDEFFADYNQIRKKKRMWITFV